MTDVKATGRKVMAAQLVAGTIGGIGKDAKAELLPALLNLGSERLRVKGDDGTDYGTIVVAGGSRKAKVADERAFLAYVKATYPTEVVEVVREAFAKSLLDAASGSGDAVAMDPRTGAVIPGVEIREGEPYLTVRPTPVAKELMADTLASSPLLALTAGLPEAGGPDAS